MCTPGEYLGNTQANVNACMAAEETWRQTKEEVLHRGWFGRVELALTVQDGTIQSIETRTNRCHKP